MDTKLCLELPLACLHTYRGTNLFGIRINTAAESRTTFVLEYEELLLRRLSEYQQVINLNPGNLVEDFQVTVRVIDEQGIAVFTAPTTSLGTAYLLTRCSTGTSRAWASRTTRRSDSHVIW